MVTVVFIAGLAGTGKSTLGDALAQSLGGVHLDFDVVSRSVVERGRLAHPDLSEADLLVEVKDERYAALRSGLERHAASSPQAVVVSAPFTRQITDPQAWSTWAQAAPQSLLVWLYLDPQERDRRIAARGATRDRGVLGPAGAMAPAVPHLALDASAPTPDLVRAVLAERKVNKG